MREELLRQGMVHAQPVPGRFSQKLDDGTLLYGWNSEPPLTPFAPDYTYLLTEKKIFSEEECKEWNVFLLKQEQILLDKYRTAEGDGGVGLGTTSISSRKPHYNLMELDFHLIEHLKTKIFNGIKTILSVSDNTNWQETLYANSWFNVLREGEAMKIHSHGYHKNSFYGFNLTINAIETFNTYYQPESIFSGRLQEDAFHVPNKMGYLTLFPNYIPHDVSPNRHKTPRTSIAGDIHSSTFLDEPEHLANNKNITKIGTYDNQNNKLQEAK